MYEILFVGFCSLFLVCLWPNAVKVIMNMVIRCLFGLVCIYLCNELIAYFGGNITVKINEITACVSALLGTSGVAALYALQLFFTMG